MKRALISKNKFKLLDGTVPSPDSFHQSYDAWECCNNLIHSWIVNYVSSQIARSIVHIENAAAVWKLLRERFAQPYLTRVADLQHKLYLAKQGTLSVTEFLTQLTEYREELESFSFIFFLNEKVYVNNFCINIMLSFFFLVIRSNEREKI